MNDYGSLINKAKEFAKSKHKGQYYGDKDYYEWHIVGVVEHLKRGLKKNFGGSNFYNHLLVVAYLHDTLEDTDTTKDEIKELFGNSIAHSVDILTRKDKEIYADYISRVLEDETATVVKYYDVLYNLNQLMSDSIVGKLNIDLYSRYMKTLTKLGGGLIGD